MDINLDLLVEMGKIGIERLDYSFWTCGGGI